MEFGAIIIGDEILSAKRADKHMPRLIGLLGARDLELAFCEYIGDVPSRIIDTLRRTYAYRDTAVFCFGGIGATPDDHTRQCAAAAAGVPLVRHAGAVAEMEAQFGHMPADHPRYLMADLPEGCELVPNPFNRVPGFSVGHHYFLPGFPEMAGPMMEWILDHRYAHLHHKRRTVDEAIVVRDAAESALMPVMSTCVESFPDLKLFSLPRFAPEGRRIEVGFRGEPARVAVAMETLRTGVRALGFAWDERAPLR
ncbi:MAG: molybdopterin-binding protein [Burkholderiales bacterium]|jgi:molybdopterin-biosynthesis enzyme MoeA-like protein|nr:molybdopterin-binding protein [Burkholderiales bacterium]